jgi:hypothetical protein
MKQVMVMILGFGVFAIPALAAVNFTATDAGSQKLTIAYTTTDGDLPRGVALRVNLSDGAMVDFAAPVVVAPAFNTFIDWAYSNPLNYQVGNGNPLALATAAGALTADASEFSICMGVFDQTGTQRAGPAAATLITIQLKMGSPYKTTVTISGDTLRGPASGVVGSVLTSNLPITVQVGDECGLECLRCTGPDYPDWVAWGKPNCWCYERQCRGDINGKKDGIGKKFYVAGPDLARLKLAYAKSDADLKLIANGICSDLNHKADGVAVKYRVSGTDLGIFKLYYAKDDAAVPSCDMLRFYVLP